LAQAGWVVGSARPDLMSAATRVLISAPLAVELAERVNAAAAAERITPGSGLRAWWRRRWSGGSEKLRY
jgi:hypothetical protein